MVKSILDAAIAGDIQACKIVLDRLLPPLKATAQSILPARLKARLRASLRVFAQLLLASPSPTCRTPPITLRWQAES